MPTSRGAALLLAWRIREGLSQNAAAKRLPTDRDTYVNWESGRIPSLVYAAKIEDVAGIPMRAWLEPSTEAEAA